VNQRFGRDDAAAGRGSLAELLREFRLAAGLTQEQLGARAGLSARTISDLERGIHKAPYRYTLDAVTGALNLSPEQKREVESSVTRARGSRRETGATQQPIRTIPRPLTPIFGREEELDTLMRLIRDEGVGLLTLTGMGGVGKTRLAFEIGYRMSLGAERNVIPVWLEKATRPDLLSTIAAAVGLGNVDAPLLAEHIAVNLVDQPTLLILNNLDVEIDVTPQFLDLLQSCPELQIIVTSRNPLQIPGERIFLVEPLYAPEIPEDLSLREIAEIPAVQMFLGLAGVHGSGFRLTERNAPFVLGIVKWLDGLPLPIELAAAQTAALTPREILDGLQRRSHPGQPSEDTSAEPQRAVNEAIRWSYALMTPVEQRLLRVCGVFSTDWTLERLHAFDDIGLTDYPGLLGPLVNRGLVRRSITPDGQSHFRMPRLVREFAQAELRYNGEFDEANERLVAFVLRRIEESPTELQVKSSESPRPLLDSYAEDLKTTLDWLLTTGRTEVGVRLLWRVRYWMLDRQAWLMDWLRSARDSLPGSDGAGRTMAGALIAAKTTSLGDFVQGPALVAEAVTELRRAGLETEALDLIRLVAWAPTLQPKLVAELEGDVERYRQAAVPAELGHALSSRAVLRLYSEDYEGCVEDSLEAFQLDQWLVTHTDPRLLLAIALILTARLEEAREVLESAVEPLLKPLTTPAPFMLALLGAISQRLNEPRRAAVEYGQALRRAQATGSVHALGLCVSGAAWLASLAAEWNDAARLLGAASRSELPRNIRLKLDMEPELATNIKQNLVEPAYGLAFNTGLHQPLRQVLSFSMTYLDAEQSANGSPATP
jgi:predicted ATPase/DNA-binding XRE family transcriptional regulator